MNNANIATDTCDTCNQKGPVVVFYQRETPVLTQCRHCDPKNFEAAARRDIDNWLSAGR